MLRKVLSLVIAFICVFNSVVLVNAAEIPKERHATAILTISDPETGSMWQWNLSDGNNDSLRVTVSNAKSAVSSGEISVNVTDYIMETFASRNNGFTTLEDDITLTTGLTYSYNQQYNTVRLYNVFGSTSVNGDYYASNREVLWRNPGCGIGYEIYPQGNTWNEPVSSEEAKYEDSAPPYSRLNCEIHVNGMSAYRDVSITFYLLM